MSDARRPRARPRPLSDEEAMALAGKMIAQARASWRHAQGMAPPPGLWRPSGWRRLGRRLGRVTVPAPLAACAELSIIALMAMTAIGGLVCERMA